MYANQDHSESHIYKEQPADRHTGVVDELTSKMGSARQDFTLGDPTELATTAPTNQTTGSSATSSSSSDLGFYFRCAVVVIGVVGTAANGLVLYAMVASKQHTKHVLIFNQNLLDLASCLFMSITYAIRFCDINLDGTRGYWLCLTVLSEGPSWGPFLGSLINLGEGPSWARFLAL